MYCHNYEIVLHSSKSNKFFHSAKAIKVHSKFILEKLKT